MALVLHGLNFRPSSMDQLIGELNAAGVDAYRGVLQGHDGDEQAFKTVSSERHLATVSAAYDEARRRADQLGVPLIGVGFSQGGLMLAELQASRSDARLDQLVLLAPGLCPKWFTRALDLLYPLQRLPLPSTSPEALRANAATPVAAYTAFLDAVDDLRERDLKRLNVPTLVLMDPTDPLIDYAATQAWVSRPSLNRWRLVPINAQSTLAGSNSHFVIHPATVGPAAWEQVRSEIRAQLGQPQR